MTMIAELRHAYAALRDRALTLPDVGEDEQFYVRAIHRSWDKRLGELDVEDAHEARNRVDFHLKAIREAPDHLVIEWLDAFPSWVEDIATEPRP